MNHERYDDVYIRGILNTVKTIAMVGVSANTSRPSYFAFKYLLERRYHMIPVNPGLAGKELLGQKVYAKLADIPEPVDMVDIFRASQYARAIVGEAIELTPRRGGGARRGERDEGGDEPLPQDRVWPAVIGDQLDGRQFANHHVAEGQGAWRRHPADVARSHHPGRRRDHGRGARRARGRRESLDLTNSRTVHFACGRKETSRIPINAGLSCRLDAVPCFGKPVRLRSTLGTRSHPFPTHEDRL
jgi:predicted CoA-binding protein